MQELQNLTKCLQAPVGGCTRGKVRGKSTRAMVQVFARARQREVLLRSERSLCPSPHCL